VHGNSLSFMTRPPRTTRSSTSWAENWKLLLIFYLLQEPRLLQSLSDWGLYWSDKTGARIRALERLDAIHPAE
jgi:hypothetical protein